jgi:DNA-binding beta-propeller fold protein YncE
MNVSLMRYALAAIIATSCGAVIASTSAAKTTAHGGDAVLPSGWQLRPPQGIVRETDTMPQGAAASPDGKILAVVDSGFNPATLRLYDTTNLAQVGVFPLQGAFGRPLWMDSGHILVAGDNADAIFDVDVAKKSARRIAMPAKSRPIAIARAGDGTIAVAEDGDGSVRFGGLNDLAKTQPVRIGLHPGRLIFTNDSRTLFVADRSGSSVTAVDTISRHVRKIQTGLHPADLLIVGDELYVAASDADAIDVYDVRTDQRIAEIFVGDAVGNRRLAGASPNGLAARGGFVFVSLGAANSVAVLRQHRLVSRIATGWYPTDMVPIGRRLFLIDGKGERMRPNPKFDAKSKSFHDYVAAIQYGSIRTFDIDQISASTGNPQGAVGWGNSTPDSTVRTNGPIRHVFFILKENRSYDQVLGDVRGGDGDPALVWFGAATTPNQHALANRFGLFDNAYASGEVSDSGHNWADAAFANDFVERVWPLAYGGRRDDDDVLSAQGAPVPRHGFIWEAAAAAHVSFRDYGELTNAPSLHARFDPKYVGWDLNYSDVDRAREWDREFDAFVKGGSLPQLEYIWLPNDHTYGSRAGKLTPAAYVAINDYAVGSIVDKISHSSAWASSAIFIIEDDAQDGADHVSAQRTTLYVASPYARGGVVHDHYSTMSILRTIEIMLGMPALSSYDAMAVPLYDAFDATSRLQPFRAIRPNVDLTARNAKVAYGAKISAELDFSRPDAIRQGILLDILAHNRGPALNTWRSTRAREISNL